MMFAPWGHRDDQRALRTAARTGALPRRPPGGLPAARGEPGLWNHTVHRAGYGAFLAWARERWACVVVNLHVDHTPSGLAYAASAFRRLIDLAIRYGGSYYLTYHRWATRAQVETCYPQFPEFLRLKRRDDPAERFQSDWYRHCKRLLGRHRLRGGLEPAQSRRERAPRRSPDPAPRVARADASPPKRRGMWRVRRTARHMGQGGEKHLPSVDCSRRQEE